MVISYGYKCTSLAADNVERLSSSSLVPRRNHQNTINGYCYSKTSGTALLFSTLLLTVCHCAITVINNK